MSTYDDLHLDSPVPHYLHNYLLTLLFSFESRIRTPS